MAENELDPGSPVVLVVEDDDDLRESINQYLSTFGYFVLTAANGEEALRILEGPEVLPSMILLDLHMPVKDGYGFIAEQQRNPRLANIPTVVMTSDEEGGSRVEGAFGMLIKPVRADHLVSIVRQLCGCEPNACRST